MMFCLVAPLTGASTEIQSLVMQTAVLDPSAARQTVSPRAEQDLQRALKELKVQDAPINPQDLLEVRVYQEDDLRREVRVSDSGSITLPLVGSVKVAGRTVAEAESMLAQLLGEDYLIDPQVSIFVKEYQDKRIFILGQVHHPASYPLPMDKRLTVVEAISQAGGFTELAALDRTCVIRIRDGLTERITVKVSDITHHGDRMKDIPVLPNDIIFVPEVFF